MLKIGFIQSTLLMLFFSLSAFATNIKGTSGNNVLIGTGGDDLIVGRPVAVLAMIVWKGEILITPQAERVHII